MTTAPILPGLPAIRLECELHCRRGRPKLTTKTVALRTLRLFLNPLVDRESELAQAGTDFRALVLRQRAGGRIVEDVLRQSDTLLRGRARHQKPTRMKRLES
jgi:hypothetical protein